MKYFLLASVFLGAGVTIFYLAQPNEKPTVEILDRSKDEKRTVASIKSLDSSPDFEKKIQEKFKNLNLGEKKFLNDFKNSATDRAVAEGLLLSRYDSASDDGEKLLMVLERDREAGINSLIKAIRYKDLKNYHAEKGILIELARDLANDSKLKSTVMEAAKEQLLLISSELPSSELNPELSIVDKEFIYVQTIGEENGIKLASLASFYDVTLQNREPAAAKEEVLNLYKQESNPVVKNMLMRSFLQKNLEQLDDSDKREFKEAGFDMDNFLKN